MNLIFGDQTQVNYFESMKEPEVIADRFSRADSARYEERKWPEIMFRKNFSYEQLRWTCPHCGVENYIRPWPYNEESPIITPRVYLCHNSRCHVKRFYWRDHRNTLWARYIGKFEEINELDFKSNHDPLKFYSDLPEHPVDPKQTTLFV